MNRFRLQSWPGLVVVATLAALAIRLWLIAVPLERDEGCYAYIADRWLAGDTPYRDAIDSKPPGVFAVYALALSLHHSVATIHATLLAVTLLSVFFLYGLAKRRFGERVAGLAAAMLALAQVAPTYFGFSANAEMYMVVFILAALWLADRTRRRPGPVAPFAVGVLFGAAALFKPVALTEGLPLALLLLGGDEPFRRRLMRAVFALLGFALALIACWLYFARLGVGREMWFWAFAYNFGYTSRLSGMQRLASLVYEILNRGMLWRDAFTWLFAIVGFLSLIRRKRAPRDLFPAAWLVSAFIGVAASGRFTPHYWQQWLPPLCLTAALGADAVWRWLLEKLPGSRPAAMTRALLVGLLVALPTLTELPLIAQGPLLARTLFGLNPFLDGPPVGKYLAQNTRPEETIYIVGSEPQLLFYARREHASPILFYAPLTAPTAFAAALQRRVWQDIERRRPRYLVWVNLHTSLVLEKNSPPDLIEGLKILTAGEYTREAALVALSPTRTALVTAELPPVGQGPIVLDIYRRRDPPAPVSLP